MDTFASAVVIVSLLIVLLVWTSGRFGRPRLYMGRLAALWLVVVILALIVVRLLVD